MGQFLDITKALSDETRVRALLSLRKGELCLCQIIDLLHLAPSTVSRHMDLLCRAGLIERRKQGRWHYFRLVGRGGSPAAREALHWALRALDGEAALQADARKLARVRGRGLKETSTCYRAN